MDINQKFHPEELISAGYIGSSDGKEFFVVFCKNHKTLKVWDRVVMVETPLPDLVNLFLRLSDNTLHSLQADGEYVIVVKAKPETRGEA